ncbi:MAG: hypothetical protein U0807_08595 [Candidatus Binatia bacterium]
MQATLVPDVSGLHVVQMIVHDGDEQHDHRAVDGVHLHHLDEPSNQPRTACQSRPSPGSGNRADRCARRDAPDRFGRGLATLEGNTTSRPSFVADVPGRYVIQLIVADGSQDSQPVTTIVTVAATAPAVTFRITAPADGAIVGGGRIAVRGTVQGAPAIGVAVNGVPAAVSAGTFVAVDVPVAAGVNEISAVASVLVGEAATAAVSVTAEEVPPTLTLSASRPSGIAPVTVTFDYSFGSDAKVQSLEMDFDGDGNPDLSTTDASAPLVHEYASPGIYVATLRLADFDAQTWDASTIVVIQDGIEVDTMFKGLWDGMNTALLAGDTAGALTFVAGGSRTRYGPVFEILLPHMPEIIASSSPLQAVNISARFAEYAVTRTIAGESRLFLIDFIRDADGVWRIASM